ncbi:MAG: hypothetical protein V7771_01305 [Shewanella psychromarinicola]|mgnify:FL=1|jgi:hypothetical protein|uniref:Uncharacterized protein n=1 Tax=Shewanella psychromarinicola TaxID=2487742 RepID=A0A3N4DWK4_9GAMM|nr:MULTISPECIES: hypothetical protein [Shewanella]AZG35737.1 hypothetical protein EGC80_13140 [Shewanella psychromarinicola]MCL1081460.1 hypothetical protein [Shewanella psychromarinicola]PKG77047.1 hypothetical protein CXF80_01160 [Shewanella sp. Actino-trap-3]RPA30339.1 hypothetical protein EGC77_14870 [Shewanella psychromarinicola]|tara:strand:- start:107198 stop:107647 length:450 start_codon:yes stop_codon:yes gene_type:complete
MKRILITLACVVFSSTLFAKDRLEIYEDYDLGTEIMVITTVKVDPNMSDVYLAGLSGSWVKAVKIEKELGFIKDWKIYASDLPVSGDFNMLLVVTMANGADIEPNKKKYEAFMKKWSEADQKMSNEISAKYPEVRTLTGEYRMREIMMK